MEEEIKKTNLWELYEKGRKFNSMKNLYSNTDKYYDFYLGNQWQGLKCNSISPVCYNIIEPIVNHKVATINENLWAINYSSENFDNIDMREYFIQACELLNKRSARLWEKDQLDYKIRAFSKDSAIVGEGIIYVDYDEETNDPTHELLNNTDICYGDENSSDIQSQPYIIIKMRRSVSNIQSLARKKGVSEEEIKKITSDTQVQEEAGVESQDEVDDKCTVLIKMYKKDNQVFFERATKYVTLQKDSNTGLTLYPLVHMIWTEVKGSARGMGEVAPLIYNQMEINKTLMRRLLIVKLHAYPKNVVNTTLVQNPESCDKVGVTVKVNKGTVDDVRKAFTTISPTNMSSDANLIQTEMITKTRELKNASELATGNVDPSQASGKAILAVQRASNLPLGEYTLALKKAIEDLGRIHLDMWSNYAEEGLKIISREKTMDDKYQEEIKTISTSILQQLKATIKVDITPISSYDKMAVEQSLENLLTGKYIDFEEYVSSLDDNSVMPKPKLEEIIKTRKMKEQQIQSLKLQANNLINSANKVIDATDNYSKEQFAPETTQI